ncbi:MAG: nitroreductase family deazaflavin-dependent oxidoreductase [Tetrasphaera sp.]
MPWPRRLHSIPTRVNALALRLAGRHAALADLEHVGRTTGTVRHTPLRAFRRGDVVVIGANFGRESDWVKNVLAAGRARIRLQGEDVIVIEPRLATLAEASHLFPRWFAFGLRHVVRTEHCLVCRVAHPPA